LEYICQQVGRLARWTGLKVLSLRKDKPLEVETKGVHDFVTNIDKYSESTLVDELQKIYPEAGFIAEEGTRTDRSEEYNWIIDPIDGTTNFIHFHPPFAISIALAYKGKPIVGVVYEMGADELFTAWEGGGAYLNGNPIHVAELPLSNGLVATGFPYNDFSRLDNYIESLRYLMQNAAGVRRLGSAATDLAYVACGRVDAFYEYDLKPYDVAAGCVLVTEAGGKVADFRGGDDYIFGREIVAASGKAYPEFQSVVSKYLAK
jgi:myo-inositol-1(or 4)-monophosphatase